MARDDPVLVIDQEWNVESKQLHYALLLRAPLRKTATPALRSNNVEPMTLAIANPLWGSVSGGTTASTIVIDVVSRPTDASSMAMGFPPGSRAIPAGKGSRCSRIIARNKNTNGMKYVMIDMLTRRS